MFILFILTLLCNRVEDGGEVCNGFIHGDIVDLGHVMHFSAAAVGAFAVNGGLEAHIFHTKDVFA